MEAVTRSSSMTRSQIAIILDYMEQNEHFYKGKLTPSFTNNDRKKMWEELTEKLNSQGGCCKVASKWQRTWTDWKSNVKRKAASLKMSRKQTGGGTNTTKELTDLEERCAALIGDTLIQGLTSVIDPESDDAIEITDSEVTEVKESPDLQFTPMRKKRKMELTPAVYQELLQSQRLLTQEAIVMRESFFELSKSNTTLAASISEMARSITHVGNLLFAAAERNFNLSINKN